MSTEQQINSRFLLAVQHITDTEEYATPNIRQLAISLGMDYTHLHKIVKGSRSLSLPLAADICARYRISPAWLLLGQGTITQTKEEMPPENPIYYNNIITRLENLEKAIAEKNEQ